MSLVRWAHGRLVLGRRVDRLAHQIQPFLRPGARVLDIGAGDGRLAAALLAGNPSIFIEGVDVLVRPGASIAVAPFDGLSIPLPDQSVDYALLIDVLHHAKDPERLLREALRISRLGVVLKDHLAESGFDHVTLRLMDWVGNTGYGVRIPYRYFSRCEWTGLIGRVGAQIVMWRDRLRLYPAPAHWVFDRGLHFLALLTSNPTDHAGHG